MFDPQAIRRQFPLLAANPGLTYLDSAASAQKPEVVIKAMSDFLLSDYASVHRGLFPLAERATNAYENARETVRHFVNAKYVDEMIFTRGTTEAINLVARSLGEIWQAGLSADEAGAVIITRLDHHANIVPWLQLAERKKIEIRWVDLDEEGSLKMDQYEALLADGRVKMVALTGQSNVLGNRPDLARVIAMAHKAGALVCIDAAQLAVHEVIDVQTLECDFLAFSGHKLYGPTGIGVLYGKRALLRDMPPFLGGGMMLREVADTGFIPDDAPAKFEAGTPPITEAIGLGVAIKWLQEYSIEERSAHEKKLLTQLVASLRAVPGVTVLGPADASKISGCVSFVVDGAHAHDIAAMLGEQEICVRAGNHCAQPLHAHLGVPASTRVSVGIYTAEEDIVRIAPAIEKARNTLTGH